VAQAATFILFVSANKLTTAASAVFIQATYPVCLVLLGPWLLHERVRRRDLLVLAASAAGLGLFFLGAEPPARTAPRPVLGNLLAVGSGLSLALMLIGLRWLARDPARNGAPAAAVTIGHLLAVAACTPWALRLPVAPRDLALVGYMGVFQSGLAHVLLAAAIPHVPALAAALILYVEPGLSLFWAFLVHGERPGPLAIAGGLLILAATAAWNAAALRDRPPLS
jgi:drug/metabolite transporter (DMT)-like permease